MRRAATEQGLELLENIKTTPQGGVDVSLVLRSKDREELLVRRGGKMPELRYLLVCYRHVFMKTDLCRHVQNPNADKVMRFLANRGVPPLSMDSNDMCHRLINYEYGVDLEINSSKTRGGWVASATVESSVIATSATSMTKDLSIRAVLSRVMLNLLPEIHAMRLIAPPVEVRAQTFIPTAVGVCMIELLRVSVACSHGYRAREVCAHAAGGKYAITLEDNAGGILKTVTHSSLLGLVRAYEELLATEPLTTAKEIYEELDKSQLKGRILSE